MTVTVYASPCTGPRTREASGRCTVTMFTSISTSVSYFGSWLQYDVLAEFSCFGRTAPCRASNRDYLINYPALAKMSLSVTQAANNVMSGFVAFDNLTNSMHFEASNIAPVMGRISTVGVRLTY